MTRSLPIDDILHGDCMTLLAEYPENHFDAIVTDPPYGLGEVKDLTRLLTSWLLERDDRRYKGKSGFMAQEWDAGVPGPLYWKAMYRVMKPGAHLVVFAGTRTWDLMSMAIRLAGFENRDTISVEYAATVSLDWVQGEGFPKSHNIGKQIDAYYDMEQEVVGHQPGTGIRSIQKELQARGVRRYTQGLSEDLHPEGIPITEAVTDDAKRYQGYGTALKPSHEPILVFRKPLSEPTIAENVLKYGTAGLNIDRCRNRLEKKEATLGRWPSNLLLVHHPLCTLEQCQESCPAFRMDAQTGVRSSGARNPGPHHPVSTIYGNGKGIRFVSGEITSPAVEASSGGASRYFNSFYYEPKAKKKEKEAGCEDMEDHPGFDKNKSDIHRRVNPDTGEVTFNEYHPSTHKNTHVTVKPLALMRWLVRLVMPPDGLLLDPFAGSGSTCIAAFQEGVHFLGMEKENTKERPYVSIAKARLAYARRKEQQ